MAISGCRECNETFWSISAFDMHRTGSYGEAIYDATKHIVGYTKHQRRCLTEQEMVNNGMLKNSRGIWTTGEFDASVFAKNDAAGGEEG